MLTEAELGLRPHTVVGPTQKNIRRWLLSNCRRDLGATEFLGGGY